MPTDSEADPSRPSRHASARLQNAAITLALAFAACSTSGLPAVARNDFATSYRCQAERVEPRPDLDPSAYEVTGCGNAVIYTCAEGTSNDAVDIAPSCRATTWCTKHGCATDEPAIARDVFAKDASCPVERVMADRVANPDQPPAEIAADPQRLEMWRTNERNQTHNLVFVSARGCGGQATYECTERPPQSPSCRRVTRS
jgi:hypothetical protein